MNNHLVLFTPKSGNRKTGPMPVSLTDQSSCPPSCGLIDECYARYHWTKMHWQSVTTRGYGWRMFCQRVSELPPGQIWRHNEAGDLPGLGDDIDSKALSMLVEANRGKRGFTYTHKPTLGTSPRAKRNRRLIAQANADGFVVNLSADSMQHADALVELGIAPVAVVLPRDASRKTRTPKGRPVTICPHALRPGEIQCITCGLCAKQRRVVVGLPAHGPKAKRLSKRLAS